MSAAETTSLFERRIDFDPAADFDPFLRQAPPKWVVYLLADADDRPVQLLCVKNLRNSLKRRLGGQEVLVGPSRRIDYRDLVRRVHWRRVDSVFEADWLYYEVARRIFPKTYRGMVGFRPAWFLHVNPEVNFPRYVKTTDLLMKSGLYVGPVEDKHAAGRLIEMVQDAFDLCRYYNLLVLSPNAKACAYKEMGKCPAPCDGTISLEQYRRLIEWSAKVLADPEPAVRDQQQRMRQAAEELRFETAGKIKQYAEQLAQMGKGPFRHARRLQDFSFLSLQHGPHEGTTKAFIITRGCIDEVLGIISSDFRPAEMLRAALERVAEREATPLDEQGVERIGIVSHHLFNTKATGAFLRLDSIDEKSIATAYKEIVKRKPVEAQEADEEGVMKELQSL